MNSKLTPLLRDTQRITSFIHAAIVCLLMVCLVIGAVQLGEFIFPAWNGAYLIVIGLLVSIEAQYTTRLLKTEPFNERPWLFRMTEFVVILILLKVLVYSLQGFGVLLSDVQLWGEDFLLNFFSGEYLFVVILIGAVWGLSAFFSEMLYQLEGDEELLALERESRIGIHRRAIRETLAVVILIIGILLSVAAAIIYLNRPIGGGGYSSFGVTHLMLYFVLGLVLLSLTQFSVLRVHWVLDNIPFKSNLAIRWVVYSLAILLSIGFISLLLPTNYSVGILDFLNSILWIVLWALWFIAFAIVFPIVYLISLIMRIGGQGQPVNSASIASRLPKPPEQIAPQVGWMDWVKTLLFWAVFIGVILFSFIYFVRQNEVLMSRLRQFRLLRGIGQFFHWFIVNLRGAKNRIQQEIAIQVQRYQARRKQVGDQRPGFLSLRRLTPRQKVLFYYLAMVRRFSEKGFPRPTSATPSEYSQELVSKIPEAEQDIQDMTAEFNEARYSSHPVIPQQASVVQQIWERLKKALRRPSPEER